jgi:cytosine/uracil/thiamine/allantoin permease
VVRNAEKISMTFERPDPHNYHWLAAVILFGIVYLFVGVAFPNPSASSKTQFIWRLAVWLICAVAFAIHIGLEHFRFRTRLAEQRFTRHCLLPLGRLVSPPQRPSTR